VCVSQAGQLLPHVALGEPHIRHRNGRKQKKEERMKRRKG
jgi:hypothetical protein